MAKAQTQTLALGAAVALGGLFLWNKYKTPSVTAITDTGQKIDVPLTPSGAIDTTSAAYLTAVAQGVSNYVANTTTPNGCQNTPWGPVCPSNFNNPTLTPTGTTPVITPPTPVVNEYYSCPNGPLVPKGTPCPPPLNCGPGFKMNQAQTACIADPNFNPPLITPPPSPILPTTSEWQWSNSTEYEEICDNGSRLRRPKGSGSMSQWQVVGSCLPTANTPAVTPKCREVVHPYKEGVLDMVNLGPGGIPNKFITPPTPSFVEVVCS